MCYFLSIGTKLGPEILRSLAPAGLHVQEGGSPHLRRLDLSAPVWVHLTDGRCSCNICPTPESAQKAEEETERLIERLKKKGYSEARIERSLAASLRAKTAKGRLGPGDTTAYLLRLLQRTPSLTAFCRWHSGRLEEEAVRPNEQITVTLARVATLRPGWLPLDTPVRIRA